MISNFKQKNLESLQQPRPLTGSGNLCSARSERRGAHQKVVSFSFWGEMKTGYWDGIVANLGGAEQVIASSVMMVVFRSDGDSLPRLGHEALCDQEEAGRGRWGEAVWPPVLQPSVSPPPLLPH